MSLVLIRHPNRRQDEHERSQKVELQELRKDWTERLEGSVSRTNRITALVQVQIMFITLGYFVLLFAFWSSFSKIRGKVQITLDRLATLIDIIDREFYV
jgi:hypothetical protein